MQGVIADGTGDRHRADAWFTKYDKIPAELQHALPATAGIPADLDPVFPAVKLISALPFKNPLICSGVSFSLFCMCICNRPQNPPPHPPFMIIQHWNPKPFHDHLALDNSRRGFEDNLVLHSYTRFAMDPATILFGLAATGLQAVKVKDAAAGIEPGRRSPRNMLVIPDDIVSSEHGEIRLST